MIEYFSKVIYNGITMTNIVERVVDIKQVLKFYDIYYPYTVKDGERIDTVAYDYYGSSDYFWLILLVNDIYDPYYGWPLTYNQFLKMMEKKYGPNFFEQHQVIKHYRNVDKDYLMTVETFNALPPEQTVEWQPVSVFQYEEELNESKREIKLISNRFVAQIDKEMQELFA